MDDFKNSTRMKMMDDMRGQGAISDADRRLVEKSSRPLTSSEMRAAKALMMAKAAAPKRAPMIQPTRGQGAMSAAERRMNQMDRPTNNMGAEAYKKGGKVGASKVPFLEKKTGEKYASKAAMTKHERGESLAVKKAEGK